MTATPTPEAAESTTPEAPEPTTQAVEETPVAEADVAATSPGPNSGDDAVDAPGSEAPAAEPGTDGSADEPKKKAKGS
ncbi:MAG: hypothetical protein H0U86_02200 [Chloroflexi bacterium]|nr:hypothetical protein [Chloroflexota bacterium]